MVIENKSKLAVKEAAILAKETLERLTITKSATTVTTTTTTASKGTISVAAAEAVVGGAAMVAEGTMKPAQGTLTAIIFCCQSTQRNEANMTKLMKVANDLLSKDVIYTY